MGAREILPEQQFFKEIFYKKNGVDHCHSLKNILVF